MGEALHSFCKIQQRLQLKAEKAIETYHFRPRYALANLGHPSLSLNVGSTNRMDCRIEAASSAHLTELSQLYIAYRLFYGEAAEEERATGFIRERIAQSSGRYFLAWDGGSAAIGFMQLMPSTNTLAMRPIWLLEDLYVDVAARGQGVAGSPATVTDFLSRQLAETRCNYVVGQFAFGDLTREECLRSIALFASHVMPALRATSVSANEALSLAR